MSISDKQIEANRQNALKSTGPRTRQGKDASRLNALKHGMLSREAVIVHGNFSESRDEFDTLVTELHDQFAPEGTLEVLIVQQIAIGYWRLRRILHADSGEFGYTLADAVGQSQTVEYAGQTMAKHIRTLPPAEKLDLILRYEKALQNQLDRALRRLATLQRQRLNQDDPELESDGGA